MIRAFLFLLKLALLVMGAVWLAHRPGEVTLVWQGYEVRTSVVLLMLAVVAVAVAAAFLYTLWRNLVSIPQSLSLGSLSRRQRKGYMALTQGLVAVAAGDAAAARRLAHTADKMLKEPALTLLLQAQAAQLGGDEVGAARYFGQMMTRPETSFLGLRGMMMQTLKRGDTAGALVLARRASLLQPRAAWVLSALVDLEARNRHWEATLAALATAEKQGVIDRVSARQMRATVWLAQSDEAHARGEADAALRWARKAHDLLPGWSPAAERYATRLLKGGQPKAAAKVVERTWRADPNPALARLYAEAGGASLAPNVQVRRFERLATFNPGAAASRLALAQAALSAQLWGIARAQLDAVRAEGENAAAYRLMAELEEKESANHRLAQEWLKRAASAPPEGGWSCNACAHRAEGWTPLCPACGAPGRLQWISDGFGGARDEGRGLLPVAITGPGSGLLLPGLVKPSA